MYAENTYPYAPESVADSPATARARFLRNTYLHLGAAILLFVGIEAVLISSGAGLSIVNTMFASKVAWIGLMIAFIAGGYAAQYMARSNMPVPVQYLGLIGYVVLEAAIFLPILVISETFPEYAGKQLALQAGICTLLVFGALTFTVVATGADFSFLRPFLVVASFAALGLIIASVFLGFSLGLVFTVIMLVLAAAYILYDTSNVMHHYGPGQHVGAALALFASVALMFYYMIRLFMSLSNSRN